MATSLRTYLSARLSAPVVLMGMAFGLALFYRGGTLALTLPGLVLFGALALLRPGLSLIFVPLTAPLYLIPASIVGIRATPFLLPLHEAALLAVFGATVVGWLWRRTRRRGDEETRRREMGDGAPTPDRVSRFTFHVSRLAPHALFLIAGLLGVLLAVERGPALREFRWLIVEPLIFYALVKLQVAGYSSQVAEGQSRTLSQFSTWLVGAFVLSGAIVGLLGLLQFVGVDLVPLLGQKQCFAPDGGPCANIVVDGGARRALSVYGHPNNLGLYLGRVWPLVAAFAIYDWRGRSRSQIANRKSKIFWPWALGGSLCLGGIVVSFSRGAWLGAVAAAAALALTNGEWQTANGEGATLSSSVLRPSSLKWLITLGIALAILAGLALSIRGDVTAGSTPVRLLLWREALGYIVRHPFGIGLDQFGYYHDPNSGLSLIDPSLIGNSEQYAAHPHNLLLDIWLRLGPLGMLAFGWLLVRFFRAARRGMYLPTRTPLALGALAALIAALVHGLVDNFYFVPDLAITFWLLIALVETRGEPRTTQRVPDRET
jgi:putative inorganic carbon (hco3(-)) transporter